MSVKLKITLVLGLVFIIYISVYYGISRLIVLPVFISLEKNKAENYISHCIKALYREVYLLDTLCTNYASRNVTHEFINDRKSDYIQSHFTEKILINNQLNLMTIVNRKGEVIWSKTHALNTFETLSVRDFPINLGPEKNSLIYLKTPENFVRGLVPTEKGPMMLASRPIIPGNTKDPIKGAIIMGRLLNKDVIRNISQKINVDFSLWSVSGELIPSDERDILHKMKKDSPLFIRKKNEHTLALYTIFPDLFDKPLFLIRAEITRDIALKGAQTIRRAMYLALLGGIIILFVIWRVLQRTFNGSVLESPSDIKDSAHHNNRTQESEVDEVDILAQEIHHMMKQIYDYQQVIIHAREEAEAASQAKSKFLAKMSHEIRNPISGILGMVDLLFYTQLTDKQRRFLENIRISGKSLLSLINDILDLSKIEAGKFELDSLGFNLEKTVEETVDVFAANAHKKGVELICLVTNNVPIALYGDPNRLRQILINLMGNAVKFTDNGEIVIRVKALEEKGDLVLVRFEVRDTGIGIAPDKQKQIFSSFSQADASTSRKYGGTGLGLNICQRLVKMMGGKIGVKSEVGRGSTFWFTAQFKKQSVEISAEAAASPELMNMRALVVSSHKTRRHVLHHQLMSWGINNDNAGNGIQTLKLLHESATHGKPYDAVIIDMIRSNIDGLELVRQIKADPHIHTAHLIGLLPLNTPYETEYLAEAGMKAHLAEPIRKSQLYNILITLVKNQVDRNPLDVPQSLSKDETPVQFPCHILLVEDNPVNREISQEILKTWGCTVDSAENGKEAVRSFSLIPYDLIFMDCQMPVMDGFEAVRHIRQREKSGNKGHIPIIAVTAHAMQGDREKCLAAGMDDYLSKPFTLEKVKEILERWVPQSLQKQPESINIQEPRERLNEVSFG